MFTYAPFWFSIIGFVVIFKKAFKGRISIIEKTLFVTSCISLVLYPVLFSEFIYPNYQFRSRLFDIIIPFLLGGWVFIKKLHSKEIKIIFPFQLIIVLACSILIFQSVLTYYWNNYSHQMYNNLRNNNEIMNYSESVLNNNRKIAQFQGNWTTPTMSILLQSIHSHEIKSIIKNKNTEIWQPWNPDNKNSWPDLSKYSVRYDIEK